MICSTCKQSFSLFAFIKIHWIQTGCQRGREVWARVFAARRRGTSGRRILRAAYPNLYKTRPMPAERLARLQELKAVQS